MNSGWVAFDDVSFVEEETTINLADNPSFETTDNWTGQASADFPATSVWRTNATWGTGGANSGNYSYIISNQANGHIYSDPIPVTATEQYNLHAYLRGEIDDDDSGGAWSIRASFYDASDTLIGTGFAANGGAGGLDATTWQQKGGTVTAPAGTEYVIIRLFNYMNSGWVAFDDVSLIEVGESNNLIPNPGFETTDDWTGQASADFPATSVWRTNATYGTGGAHGGDYLYIISNQADGNIYSDPITVVPNAEYDLYAYVRGELDADDSGGGWSIRASFYDASDTLLATGFAASGAAGSLSPTWQEKGGTVTTPVGTEYAIIRLFNYMNSGWAAFDDVRFEGLAQTTIAYEYDPLYRLTDATYSGNVSASYQYVYDAVGNMEAYTETVGAETSSVNRTFDDANQLLVSTDTELGTTSFYYDGNGNLDQILPPGINPGEAGEQLYTFDQRNLITQYRVGAGSSVYDTVAEYVYVGDSNRLQQIDSSGTTPITTTYTNDNAGMSQVLVSDDGTTTTTNLFGLDLIQQDDGSETRTLLVDGLGSARVEIVGNTIETATTYEPYGKLLAQSGSSGTVYGYTGEQYDAATSLVYLRARYYNPYLNQFQSRDPFPGYAKLPQSQNGFSYVGNNPTNYIDPSGLRRCTPQEAAVDFEACDQNRPLTDSSNLFNYNVIPGSPGGSVIAYLQVNYQTLPWRNYAVQKAPHYPVLVPVRHPLNLNMNLECYDDAVNGILSSSKFAPWEVNARNIIAELFGVIAAQEEWALRDAIGVAYNPYNRQNYNALPPGSQHYHQRTGFFSGGNDLKALLLASGQYALTTTGNFPLNPGNSNEMQKVYEFSLVVAFGVEKEYFRDTSQGAVKYSHQKGGATDSFDCGETGPAFFRIRLDFSYNLTTAELERQGGWPEPVNNIIPRWLPYPEWEETPPPGCQWK